MPVSATSIILVFPPRIIVIALFRKKLSIYYTILYGTPLNLRLWSSVSYATLSKASATSILKQVKVYKKKIKDIKIADIYLRPTLSKESFLIKYKIAFIEDIISFINKKFNKYIVNIKNYLILIVEKLKDEISNFIAYNLRVKKKIKDLIQLKILVNFKIY